jgi:hypothetical protein
MNDCRCKEALAHTFTTVREAAEAGRYMSEILDNAEMIAESKQKWIHLWRCRSCGTLWAHACYSSGHMDFYYIFPAPSTGDPVWWLHDEARELPPS